MKTIILLPITLTFTACVNTLEYHPPAESEYRFDAHGCKLIEQNNASFSVDEVLDALSSPILLNYEISEHVSPMPQHEYTPALQLGVSQTEEARAFLPVENSACGDSEFWVIPVSIGFEIDDDSDQSNFSGETTGTLFAWGTDLSEISLESGESSIYSSYPNSWHDYMDPNNGISDVKLSFVGGLSGKTLAEEVFFVGYNGDTNGGTYAAALIHAHVVDQN